MATFVVCTRCGKVCETSAPNQVPKGWRQTDTHMLCPGCADANEDEAVGDVLEEEVIYPPGGVEDTLDEGYCEVCNGPCQGH